MISNIPRVAVLYRTWVDDDGLGQVSGVFIGNSGLSPPELIIDIGYVFAILE